MRIVILSALILVGFAARAAYDQSSMTAAGERSYGQLITQPGHRPS